MGHFIHKCSCGKIIEQCRCSNGEVTIIEKGCEDCKAKSLEPELELESEGE